MTFHDDPTRPWFARTRASAVAWLVAAAALASCRGDVLSLGDAAVAVDLGRGDSASADGPGVTAADAGPRDLAVPADAGSPDGAPPDLAVLDAGEVDGALADAGEPDGGMVNLAPDFTLTDGNPASRTFGQKRKLSDVRGKVLVLYFVSFG